MKKFSIAIHGGAGTISRTSMSDEKEKEYTHALRTALDAGYSILENNGPSLEAVQAAVMSLEDCPLFNAGRGSVFTHDGRHEMDASIMRGDTLMAGAVAAVYSVKNPVSLARAVMERTPHVLLCGDGAEAFASEIGFEKMPGDYFFTQQRFDQLQQARADGKILLDHNDEKKFGTVGAVALDTNGNLAAATSTGGMTNKRWGRVGDSPIIGCGTYANNTTCAVSCTGDGEFFMRSVVAYDVHCLMQYKNHSLAEACNTVVKDKLVKLGGEGGLIAVDAKGDVALVFNSEGMYRAWWKAGEEASVAIYHPS